MSTREQQRAQVLVQVLEGRVAVSDAAHLLGLSSRHLLRLLAKVRRRGLAALAHGNRGRASPRCLPAATRQRLLTLARTTYAGCNDCHLTELLAEHEALHLSRPTVQRVLRAAGMGSPRRRRPPRHRRRRERMPQAGLLVQMDGSHHPWLEDRGPRLVLHAAIDDATGEVLAGVLRPEEDAHGYFLLLHRLIQRYGVPAAAYTDRHGLFHRDPRTPRPLADQLAGTVASTQIGRALQELGIHWIPAASPQGRGRIERLFGGPPIVFEARESLRIVALPPPVEDPAHEAHEILHCLRRADPVTAEEASSPSRRDGGAFLSGALDRAHRAARRPED